MVEIELKKSEFIITGKKILELDADYKIHNGFYKLSGANGSGKTVFLEYLSGFRKNVAIANKIPSKKILYLGETGIGVEDLTIMENIKLAFWIFGNDLNNKALEKIKCLYSNEQLNKIYSQSSFGMQLMVGISLIFADIDWQLIVLDETLSGIDVENRQIILDELSRRKNNSIVFLVSHEIYDKKNEYSEVSINNGKIKFK